jgi:K+-transporting ATPase KdpF subunit
MPEAEVTMDLYTAIALVLAVLLIVYLAISLLIPEKF